MTENSTSWDAIRAEVLADPAVKAAYEALEAEFDIASKLIALRASTGMTQREFADRVGMKQSQLARIESGKQIPKLETLAKLAAAAGYAVEVHFISSQGKSEGAIAPLRIAVPDVDEAKSSEQVVSPVTAFLESDDPVAVQVRERLGERSRDQRSLPEMAANLEKFLSLLEENDRLLAALKNVLSRRMTAVMTKRDSSDDEDDEIELRDLTESLVKKLGEF